MSECLQHSWLLSFDDIARPLAALSLSEDNTPSTSSDEATRTSTPEPLATDLKSEEIDGKAPTAAAVALQIIEEAIAKPCAQSKTIATITRAVSSLTDNIYTKPRCSPGALRIGLSPDRRDTFKRNMESLAQKFSTSDIVIIEQDSRGGHSRRATATHTMPSGEVFKCTPVFILGEEQQCNDSSSDTVSEISTDSSSDRSSIYSDDSLDFILYGKTQARASFPFSGAESDRWEQRHHPRAWPRECNGVVSKVLSRFTEEPTTGKLTRTSLSLTRGKTGLEALRERGGNLVVIREPVRAGRYTRYSEVQCESVQARIRRFQVQGGS